MIVQVCFECFDCLVLFLFFDCLFFLFFIFPSNTGNDLRQPQCGVLILQNSVTPSMQLPNKRRFSLSDRLAVRRPTEFL
jgi:hypothetical protein